jgi:hypothetical protein
MTAFLTVAVFRDYIGDADPSHEPKLTSALDAACATIESPAVTNRRFGKDTTPTARRFRPVFTDRVWINDAASVTTVKVDSADNGTFDLTWTTPADYDLEPADGVGSNGVPGWPATSIRAVGSRSFPCGGKRLRVEVTATWGWPAVPDPIHQAALQLAHRLFELRGAGLGVAAADDIVGVVRVARQIAGWADLVGPYSAYGARGVMVG